MLSSQARRFGEALVDRYVLTGEDLEKALDDASAAGEPFPEHVQRAYDVSDVDMAAAWAASNGVPFIDFSNDVIHPDASATVPEPLARKHRAVGVQISGKSVTVTFAVPTEAEAIHAVSEHLAETGLELVMAASTRADVEQALETVYQDGQQPAQPSPRSTDEPIDELYRLFNRVLEVGGSDLHLAANQPPYVRAVGELVRIPGEAELPPARIRELVYSILNTRQRERFEQTHELDTSHAMPGRVRFRVNVFVQRNAVGAAFRVIPYEVVPFDRLGLPATVRNFAEVSRGLVLVTGPTGSGKSSTLASLIDIVNSSRQCHIMTIEDPIEFVHKSKMALVNQRELGADTNSFSDALRAALRQDPDVIMVGEMRDLETISTAITAAETGHLVFGTLHTQDAAQTIDRIIDVFPGEQQGQVRIQLANSLQGVATQQLVPTSDGRSRAVACEIMLANTAIRALIRDGKVHQIHNQIQAGRRQGMQSLDDSLADLAKRGVCTQESAIKRARNVDEVARQLGVTVDTMGNIVGPAGG